MKLIRLLVITAILGQVSCADFPSDPKKTLDRARGATLRVGVTESSPWVIRDGDVPRGVEPELVRRFAQSIDAEIEWIWGAPEEHYAALEHYDLHLAITGATESSPWRKRLGFSAPYHRSEVVIAKPPSHPPVEEIDGRRIIVPDAGPTAGWVRDHDGIPVPVADLEASNLDDLVALEDWKVDQFQLHPTGIVLHEHRHVLVAPPGENGFLMALEDAVHGVAIAPLIEEALRFEKETTVIERVGRGEQP